MNHSTFRLKAMTDEQLVYAARQLRIKTARLWPAVSPLSARLLADYEDRLREIELEQQRRLTP